MIKALTYRTTNVGDDIQTLAALQFIGEPDGFIDREQLAIYDEEPCYVIGNGWYAHGEEAWPPSKKITLLPVSMHVCEEARKHFSTQESVEYLKQHGPVGCRDQFTLQFFRRLGVAAYFSGCLTLTFPPYCGERSGVLLVDRPAHTQLPRGESITHEIPPMFNPSKRLDLARSLIARYRTAELVVTQRLHCALPCFAMGTPVVLVNSSRRAEEMKFEMYYRDRLALRCEAFVREARASSSAS